jgi:hypothetical protein
MEVNVYKNRPIFVEGAVYDGTEACAEGFCKMWPQFFMIGVKKDGSFGDLFIQTGEGILLVAPDDIVFRDVEGGCFCSMDKESFDDYFDCITVDEVEPLSPCGCCAAEVTV